VQQLTQSVTQQNALSESQVLESEEYFEQGRVFLQDKKYKEAIKAFSKSYGLNPKNFDALFYKGVSALDNGQADKAIADLNELMEACGDYRKTAFIVLSIAYRRVNDYTGALRTLSRAIVKYPRYLEAYIARGQIYIFQKKWDKALSDFRVVI
jgi:tetratricopeptide (TPR) repeat protein